MQVRLVRILIGAAAAEAAAVLVLVVLVAIFGPEDPNSAQAYAERLGRFVGPFAALFGVIGGYLVARGAKQNGLLEGVLFGLLFAVIDVALLIAGNASFAWLFVISNVGRIVGGGLGGWIADRKLRTVTDRKGSHEITPQADPRKLSVRRCAI